MVNHFQAKADIDESAQRERVKTDTQKDMEE
jgi:hypothetical protein